MLTNALKTLEKVQEAGGHLQLVDGILKLRTKKRTQFPVQIIEEIKIHKDALIDLLQQKEKSVIYRDLFQKQLIPYDRSAFTRIPLSFSQESLWFIDKLEGSTHYHMVIALELEGALDTEAFKEAWKVIMDRHEILRTVILSQNGQPFQEILPLDNWSVQEMACETWTEEELLDWAKVESQRPFDLSKEYMLRVHLLRLDTNRYGLLVILHHIAGDGWSLSVLGDEFSTIYRSLKRKKKIQLQALPIQYADYALWQKEYLEGELLEQKLQWWTDRLMGVPPVDLPLDYPRPTIQSTKGSSVQLRVNPQLSKKVKHLAQQEGATLFMTLLAVFKVLLYRYSGQEDICVGTSVANRIRKELEPLIGFFVNSLALRNDLSGNPSFKELLGRLRTTTLEAYQHQDIPIDMLVEKVVKKRDLSYRPLFQILFILQNTPRGKHDGLDDDVHIKMFPFGTEGAKFDLLVNVLDHISGLAFEFGYCTDLFKEETISRLAHHYERLLEAVCVNPQVKIEELMMLDSQEQQSLMHDFNHTLTDYAIDESILELIEKQAIERPEAVAIVLEDELLTYRQLQLKSKQLAQTLLQQGLKREEVVGVYVNRSLDLIPGILGVLWAGGAFVPLDPEYPSERIAQIVRDCQPKWIVTKGPASALTQLDPSVRLIDLEQLPSASQQEVAYPDLPPTSLAYIMYTSGSTGRPKGVMIEHHSLLDYSLTFQNYFGITASDKVIQQASFSFDTMIEEIFPALISGASIRMIKEGGRDVAKLCEYIEQGEASILSTTPLVLAWLNKELLHTGFLRYIISGGDLLLPNHIHKLFEEVPIVNTYGPTESTVCATYHKIEDLGDTSLIGKPIANREIYILSPSQKLQAIGIAGEIYIGGAGIARGYWGNEELTAANFIEHPFKPGERLYRTGDVGKWLADGSIAFLGRTDEQVKIRGYRVEIGEIEQCLNKAEGVNECVITPLTDRQGNKQLTAYLTGSESLEKRSLQAHLKQFLPAYMIPTYWVFLDALPLLPNGKIDKQSLPEPNIEAESSNTHIAARNETERILIRIWQDLLEVDQIGIHDNFFELGGHSLLAMQVISEISEIFSIDLSIRLLFDTADLLELAQVINQLIAESDTELDLSGTFPRVNR